MAKAILIMDMPEDCNDCYAMYVSLSERFCRATEENLSAKAERPDWCPLRELPERMEICGTYNAEYYAKGGLMPSYKLGWNKCLDAIEGGAHGKEQNK